MVEQSRIGDLALCGPDKVIWRINLHANWWEASTRRVGDETLRPKSHSHPQLVSDEEREPTAPELTQTTWGEKDIPTISIMYKICSLNNVVIRFHIWPDANSSLQGRQGKNAEIRESDEMNVVFLCSYYLNMNLPVRLNLKIIIKIK